MRKLIGAAGALLLILPQIALAQGHEHGGGGHPGGGGGGHPGGGGAPHGPPAGGGGGHAPGGGGPHFGGGGGHAGGPPPGGGGHGGGDFHPQAIGGGGRPGGAPAGGGFNGGRPGGDVRPQAVGGGRPGGFASTRPQGNVGQPGPGFNRGPGPGGHGFPNPGNGGWHRGFYAGQRGGWDRIRGPRYVYPGGWGYRRWGLGAILPGILFGSAYYWNDYSSYGIYPPPPGDRWVRYGPDLLLINVRTGRVDDAIYGAFY